MSALRPSSPRNPEFRHSTPAPSPGTASAKTIAQDFARLLPASQRRTLLGIAQLIMLGELAVNRVLDNLALPG
ncbi:hypothetical protein LS633_23305 [Pseudomonas sp. NIBR-H-19]|nr:hypothetical protein [Pseudomonas sp. NIBR-H-19]UHC85096.1 hypothetical protein LS633_23305 [Pseudomonas sp. NIBR-H-19]